MTSSTHFLESGKKASQPGRKLTRCTYAQRDAILRLIATDMTLKAIAIETRVSTGLVCALASANGWRRMYVTDAERRQVLARRKAAA